MGVIWVQAVRSHSDTIIYMRKFVDTKQGRKIIKRFSREKQQFK